MYLSGPRREDARNSVRVRSVNGVPLLVRRLICSRDRSESPAGLNYGDIREPNLDDTYPTFIGPRVRRNLRDAAVVALARKKKHVTDIAAEP